MKDIFDRRDELARSIGWWKRERIRGDTPMAPRDMLRTACHKIAPVALGWMIAAITFFAFWNLAGVGTDRELAQITRSVLPDTTNWSEAEVRNRLPARQKAISLFEKAVSLPATAATNTQSAENVRETQLAADRRIGALGVLADGLSKLTDAQQKAVISELTAIGILLYLPEIRSGLVMLERLNPEERLAMFGADASGLRLFVTMFRSVLGEQDRTAALRSRLEEARGRAETEAFELNRALARHGCDSKVMSRIFGTIQTGDFSCSIMDRLPLCLQAARPRNR